MKVNYSINNQEFKIKIQKTPFESKNFPQTVYVYRKSPIVTEVKTASAESQALGDSEASDCGNHEKLAQLGTLLARVVMRQRARPSTLATVESEYNTVVCDSESAVLQAVQSLGAAQPKQIRRMTQLSRPSITRILSKLRRMGKLERKGATRRATYSIAQL